MHHVLNKVSSGCTQGLGKACITLGLVGDGYRTHMGYV